MIDVRQVGDQLEIGDQRVALSAVMGFAERWDPWRGRASVDVLGTSVRIPLGEGYGAVRRTFRATGRPFHADWQDGRFPLSTPLLPSPVALGVSGLVLALVVGILGALAPWAVVPAVGVGGWSLTRLADRVEVTTRGVRAGPSWAEVIPWADVVAVHARVVGLRAIVVVRSPDRAQQAAIPAVLVPVLRARLWRLGGLRLADGDGGLTATYGLWSAPARGIPWGLAAAGLVAVGMGAPQSVIVGTFMGSLILALLGEAVAHRASGWNFGGVTAVTLAYLLLLSGLAVAPWLAFSY